MPPVKVNLTARVCLSFITIVATASATPAVPFKAAIVFTVP
jgi:hypothetical protein